jgi:hypothetical protein
MKKNKKNGVVTINPIKLFKRFLKEKNLYSTFYYGIKFNKGFTNYFKTTEPTRYITDIDRQNVKNTMPYGTYNIINNLNDEWYSKLMFLPQKEIIENKFETFLKKRGTLNLYESCFAPYYANKVNNHTVNSDVPANAKFTDTVTTATTVGSGNAVTAISASNGALTITKDTIFATKQESQNHVIASTTQPTNQAIGDIWLVL